MLAYHLVRVQQHLVHAARPCLSVHLVQTVLTELRGLAARERPMGYLAFAREEKRRELSRLQPHRGAQGVGCAGEEVGSQ